MQVILKNDVKHLGYKDDVVKVKPGYARNFLLPKGLAIAATDSTKKMLTETLKQRAFKEEKIKTAAQKTADALKNVVIKVATKVGESGKIFGSITSIQIADAIKKAGYDVDRKNITINGDVKTTGTYTADLRLHKEVIEKVTFEVVQE